MDILCQGYKRTWWVLDLCFTLTALLHLQNRQLISSVLLGCPSLQVDMKLQDLVSGTCI